VNGDSQVEFGKFIGRVDSKLDALHTRFDKMEARLDNHSGELSAVVPIVSNNTKFIEAVSKKADRYFHWILIGAGLLVSSVIGVLALQR